MKVALYGKEGCTLCEGAKDKLKRLGVEYEYHDLQATVALHDGWQEDGSADVLAGWAFIDNHVPLIMIDGLPYRYEQFVIVIREKQRALEVAEEAGRVVGGEPNRPFRLHPNRVQPAGD